jgi:hypothetical protein
MNLMLRYTAVLIFALILGCSKELPKSHPDMSILAQKVVIPQMGKVNYISPKELVDMLNSGAQLAIYFIQESPPDNPEYVVALPGMKTVLIGSMIDEAQKVPMGKPIYLVCLYGDDSRRMAKEVAKYGHDCYYVDGGSYRLHNEMKKYGWNIRSL